MSLQANVLAWLARGERGLSSETIAFRAIGERARWESEPFDSDDFRRCLLLMERAPEVRAELPRIAELSPIWAKLVAHWDELTKLAYQEAKELGVDLADRPYLAKTHKRFVEVVRGES